MTARDARPSPRELGARELAGYRVLRSLARDEEAEVLLGHRRASTPDDEVLTVAIKTSVASDEGWDTALRQCAALERARGDHVVALLDVDADDESIRLIFERLPLGDLAELLRIRPRLDAGEAVTVLAPIASTLLRIHEAGVAHGNLSARSVLFRDDGSPTLIGFSGAELFEPGAPEVVLEQVEAVRRDRAAALSLAALVLGRIEGTRSRAGQALIADLSGCDDEAVLPVLASRLFEVAAAMPVRFAPDEPEAGIAPSKWRAIPVGTPDDVSNASPIVPPPSGLAAAVGRLVPEPLVQRLLDTVERSPAAPVLMAASRRWASWSPARRRLVLAVAAAAATVGIVSATVPAGAVATAAPASPESPSSSSWSSGPGSGASSTVDGQRDTIDPAITDDDPVAAASSLVSARDHCLSSLSLRCLDRVDEAGSSASSDDQAAIAAGQRGGELPDPLPGAGGAGPAVLIERLGDSALVRLGQAASSTSLLLVKGDGGWRIRDLVIAGATAAPTPSTEPPTEPGPSPSPSPSPSGG